jgi:hypothetical protein
MIRHKKNINKKGSITVFLSSILIAMIMTSAVFVNAARSVCGSAYSDAVLELSGRSVLAEFDRRIKDEYGLFAFYGREDMVKSSVKLYASASFNKTLPYEIRWGRAAITDIFKLKLEALDVSLKEHSLMDVDVFEKQIEDYMNYMLAEKGLEFVLDLWKDTEDKTAADDRTERTLRNQAEIQSLPSMGNASNRVDLDTLRNFADKVTSDDGSLIDSIIDGFAQEVKVNEYILSHFKYNVGGDNIKETFFKNEVEYILHGNMSDESNAFWFRVHFIALRTALNLAHIMMSSEKVDILKAAAPIVTVAGVGAIALIWAAAEAENDARRLLGGKQVALLKSDDEWALSLENAVNIIRNFDDEGEELEEEVQEKKVAGCINPSSEEGTPYEGYLRIFLFLKDRNIKLLRAMDLIQLNLRGSYYEDFLIKDHYAGFSMTATVSGKKFAYEQKY